MHVRMRTKIGGYRDGLEWPDAGKTIDVPDHEARDLIANRYAEACDADPNSRTDTDSEGPADADQADHVGAVSDEVGSEGALAAAPDSVEPGTTAETGVVEAADPAEDAPAAAEHTPVKPAAKTKKP